MIAGEPSAPLTRREILGGTRIGAVVLAGIALMPARAAGATEAVSDTLGAPTKLDAVPETGRLRLSLPPVYRDGSSVPIAVEVDSPMNGTDYVSQIHIAAPDNPLPEVARFHFTPFSGRASVATRIRLDSGEQTVVATATLSDGSVLATRATVWVTVGGCSS